MKKAILSIILGVISFLASWKWGIFSYSDSEKGFWIGVVSGIISFAGIILGILQLKEKRYILLSLSGIFICLAALFPLMILILAYLGIIRMVA
ncbi:MAG: hypothetical protein DRI01_10400 [Chloroflexi bacterium]|nr:MAG: hypothetical protein DRI01_10400 [Chloroflexota bacterium]